MSKIDIQEFQQLQARVKQLQSQRDKARGARDQLQKQLKDEFSCETLVEAKKLLTRLEQELEDANQDYQSTLESFEELWKGKLQQDV